MSWALFCYKIIHKIKEGYSCQYSKSTLFHEKQKRYRSRRVKMQCTERSYCDQGTESMSEDTNQIRLLEYYQLG